MAGSREGYYEIKSGHFYSEEMKATAFAGNLLFNGLHWHSSLEILFCLKGKIRVRLEGNVLEMEEGDILTIDSGMSHEIFDGSRGGLQIIVLIDASMLHRQANEQYELATVGEHRKSREDEEILSVKKSLRRMTWLLTPDRSGGKECSEEEWDWFHREMYNVLLHLSRNKRKVAEKNDLRAGAPQKSLENCLEKLNRYFEEELSAEVVDGKLGVSDPTV